MFAGISALGSVGIRDLTLYKTLMTFEINSYFLSHVMLSVLTEKHRTEHFVRGSTKTQAARTGDTHPRDRLHTKQKPQITDR